MKLSIMSFSMMMERLTGKMNADRLCEVAKAADVDMIDLMDVEIKIYGKENLKKAMKNTGIRCECLIGSAPFFSGNGKEEAVIEDLLALASEFGAKDLMLIPGHPNKAEISACHALTTDQKRKILVKNYSMAVEKARAYGLGICAENTPQFFKPLCSAQDCLYLLSHVEGLKFIFDTANVKIADPSENEIEFYRLMRPYIHRIHIKDAVIGDFPKGEVCANGRKLVGVQPCAGTIRLRELLPLIKEDGYDGTLVMEYASSSDVSGKGHIAHFRNQCSLIRDIWNGTDSVPEAGVIKGVEKPVSRIFFGTAIMPMLRGKDMFGLLDSVYAHGINAFDCARGYGSAEKSLGDWIRARGNRERIVLLTKCGNIDLTKKVKVNAQVIEAELQKSLETLGTDYIDIYLLHRDDPATPVGEVVEALNRAQQEGKIRVFGASNWTARRIEEANQYAKEHGLTGFTVSSPNFGLADQITDPWGGGCVSVAGPSGKADREWYRKHGIPVIAYSSLGRGFFSGKFKSSDRKAAEKALDRTARKGYLSDENLERLHRAEILSEEKGCSVAEIAMAYVFNQEMETYAIVSTTNPERMRSNIKAQHMHLTKAETEWLSDLTRRERE